MSAPRRFSFGVGAGGYRRRAGQKPLLGTPIELAVLRFYFIVGGLDKTQADAAVIRWRHADRKSEFEAKVREATKWLSKAEVSK